MWMTRENYKPSSNSIQDSIEKFWEKHEIEPKWDIVKVSTYNDEITFIKIHVNDDKLFNGSLCFTIFTMKDRNELYLDRIEIDNQTWVEKLNSVRIMLV